MAPVACARLDGPLAARPGNRVRHRCTRDGINERRLTATCRRKKKISPEKESLSNGQQQLVHSVIIRIPGVSI